MDKVNFKGADFWEIDSSRSSLPVVGYLVYTVKQTVCSTIVHPVSEYCKNKMNNFAVVHDITQPVAVCQSIACENELSVL